MRGLIIALAALAAAAGCDDAAVGGDYQGEPLLTVTGWVRVENLYTDIAGDAIERGRLRTAVLWAAPDGSGAGRSRFDVVSSVAERVDASGLFPARYELTLFSPPAPRLVQPSGGEGSYAVGVIVAFLDTDDDGRWEAGAEQLVGAVLDVALVYSPDDGVRGPAMGTVFPPGYTLASVSDDPGTCGESGQALLYARDRPEADMVVDMAFPYEAALDLDCDGVSTEWVAFCPSLEVVGDICVDPSTGGGEELCALCSAFLPPAGDDPLLCDEWLPSCLLQFPPHECEGVWRSCREVGDEIPWCGGDPVCVCDAMFTACNEDTDTARCDELRVQCFP